MYRLCFSVMVLLVSHGVASFDPMAESEGVRHLTMSSPTAAFTPDASRPVDEDKKDQPLNFATRLSHMLWKPFLSSDPQKTRSPYFTGPAHHFGFPSDLWRGKMMPFFDDPEMIAIMKQVCKASYREFSAYPFASHPQGYGGHRWRGDMVGQFSTMTPYGLLKHLEALVFFKEVHPELYLQPGLSILRNYRLCPTIFTGYARLREKFPDPATDDEEAAHVLAVFFGGDQAVSCVWFSMKTLLNLYLFSVNFTTIIEALPHPEFPPYCQNIYGFNESVFPLLYGATSTFPVGPGLARLFFTCVPTMVLLCRDTAAFQQEWGARIGDLRELLNFKKRFFYWITDRGRGQLMPWKVNAGLFLYSAVLGWMWNPFLQKEVLWNASPGPANAITAGIYATEVVNASGSVLKDNCCTVLGHMVQSGCQVLPAVFPSDQMIQVWNMTQPAISVYQGVHAAAPSFLLGAMLIFHFMFATLQIA